MMSMLLKLCKWFLLSMMLTLPVSAWAEDEEAAEDSAVLEKVKTEYLDLEPAFVTNYGGTGRLRFLRAEVSLRVIEGKKAPVLRHMPAIRDKLIRLLARQTDDEVSTVEGKELLRQSALKSIQEFLEVEEGENSVTDLLFGKFIIQR